MRHGHPVGGERCRIGTLDVTAATLGDVDLRGAQLSTVNGLGGLAGAWISQTQLTGVRAAARGPPRPARGHRSRADPMPTRGADFPDAGAGADLLRAAEWAGRSRVCVGIFSRGSGLGAWDSRISARETAGSGPKPTVPPARRTSSRTMARPRPVPPASRSRASSSRVNRSKTRSRSAGGMPGPSSVDRRAATCPRAAAAGGDPASGVPDGVVDEVGQRPAQLVAVAATTTTGGPRPRRDRHPGAGVPASDLAPAARRGRTGRRAGPAAAVRRPGPAAAGPRPARRAGRRRPAGRPAAGRASPSRWATSSWVRMLGQRAAQLVRGVGDERALPRPGGRQPVQHVVEGPASALDLVARRRHRQPAGPGRSPADRAPRRAAARSTGRSVAADHPPGDHRQHGQQQRDRDSSEVRSTSWLCRHVAAPCAATITVPGRPAARPGRRRTRSGPTPRPATPGTITVPPARARSSSAGRSSGGQPVGVTERADHPALGVDDLDHLGRRLTGTGSGSRARSTSAATVARGRRAPRRRGCVDQRTPARRTARTPPTASADREPDRRRSPSAGPAGSAAPPPAGAPAGDHRPPAGSRPRAPSAAGPAADLAAQVADVDLDDVRVGRRRPCPRRGRAARPC